MTTILRAPRSALAALLLLAACSLPQPTVAPPPMYAKRAESPRGVVTASHADAAAAGATILRQGGNAVDAAVATAFALAVVDPSQTGIGAGGGMIVWNAATHRAEMLEFYSRTGADADWARFDSVSARQPINGRAAGIPGAVAGLLDAHAKYGKLPRAQVMAPAIALARDGFIVSPLLARTADASRAKLSADTAAAALFLPGGVALRPGDKLVQAQLARTLEAIAAAGKPAFYEGAMAERTVAKMRQYGSVATAADFKGYPVAFQRPLCTSWMGYTLLSAPPPLGGAVPLGALNLLAASKSIPLGSPTTSGAAAVQIVNALRVAESDAGKYRGDPAYFGVPARGLVSPAYAAKRAGVLASLDGAATPLAGDPWPDDAVNPTGACATLDGWGASALGPDKAAPMRQPRSGGDEAAAAADAASAASATSDGAWAGSNTTHFSVVDGDHNAVSMTFTVGVLFGSGVYVNGFFLNSGAANLDNGTRGPNRYASSTINPTIVLSGNDVRMVVGAAGSQYIPTSTTQVTWRHLALGEDPWTAIASPRLQPAAGRSIEVEAGFAPDVYAALRAKGYLPLSRVGDIMFGGVHMIAVTKKTIVGVADPRRDGAAVAY